LITGDEEDKKPQIFTLTVTQPRPAISGPPQKSDEIISFTPQEDPSVISFQPFTNIQPVEPIIIATTEAPVVDEVTPIVADKELKSVFQDPQINQDVLVDDVEVIDLRGNPESPGFVLVNEENSDLRIEPDTIEPVPSLPTQVTNDDNEVFIEDIIEEELTTVSSTEVNRIFLAEASTESVTTPTITTTTTITTTASTTELVSKTTTASNQPTATTNVPETQPTTELRQITFKILDDEEEDSIDPEITFTLIDPTEQPDQIVVDTFSTATNLEDVPPTISADPVFQEIVSGATSDSEESAKFKRFSAYDPRHQAVYAHKYRDNYSNWYYFRRGY